MSFENFRECGLDYRPCAHGAGKRLFRGPERTLTGRGVLALGGTQTFGKFVADPWPDKLERILGQPVINLGSINAGPDLYLNLPGLPEMARQAHAAVIELFGAGCLTNRFYRVHGLRNDRFLAPSADLEQLFPEVDFTAFTFVRHMLGHLAHLDTHRFDLLVSALQDAWCARMSDLIARIGRPATGLWLADRPPPDIAADPLSSDPILVTSQMLEDLRPKLHDLVCVTPGAPARADGAAGRVFREMDVPAMRSVFPDSVHQTIAGALAPALRACPSPSP